MDAKFVKEDFVKYYGGEETGIKTFKNCYSIVLYGNGFLKSELPMGGLSLSINTQTAIKETEEKKFSVIRSDMNTEFESRVEELNEFVGDKLTKEMFKACAMLKGNMKGAKILSEYSVKEKKLQRPLGSLICALGIMNNGKVPDIETVKCLMENSDELKISFLPGELYGRKNTLVFKEAFGKWEYKSFKITGYLAVLNYSNDKTTDINTTVAKKINELREQYSDLFIKETKITTDDKIKNYIINECKRAELINKEISNSIGINDNVGKIVKKSAYEVFDTFSKSFENLRKTYEIAEFTGLSNLIVPLYDIGGVCAFVKEEDVDNYCRIFSEEYQKKVGTIPTLCICDTDDSGVSSNIESE